MATRDENEIPELDDEDSSSDDIAREAQSEEAQEQQLDFDVSADQGQHPTRAGLAPPSRKKRDLDPLDSPVIDFAAYENPSTDIVDDYRNVIEDHGVDVSRIEAIARAYDSLRQTRRHSAIMIDHNNDRKLCEYFNRRFRFMIE